MLHIYFYMNRILELISKLYAYSYKYIYIRLILYILESNIYNMMNTYTKIY